MRESDNLISAVLPSGEHVPTYLSRELGEPMTCDIDANGVSLASQ